MLLNCTKNSFNFSSYILILALLKRFSTQYLMSRSVPRLTALVASRKSPQVMVSLVNVLREESKSKEGFKGELFLSGEAQSHSFVFVYWI